VEKGLKNSEEQRQNDGETRKERLTSRDETTSLIERNSVRRETRRPEEELKRAKRDQENPFSRTFCTISGAGASFRSES
jgi:4-diphosphocytidyl-2C-methyl-D-erythritol kinase